jgi:hypothetical protein
MRAMAARAFDVLATVVRVVAAVIAALIVVHAAFVLFEANPQNALVEFTESIRNAFGWFTRDLFTKPNPKMAQVIKDALAAVIWVVAGSLLSKLTVRFAPHLEGQGLAGPLQGPAASLRAVGRTGSLSGGEGPVQGTTLSVRRVGGTGSFYLSQALRIDAADCRPSSSTETSRISTLRILPVTVIGNSSTTLT